MAAFLCLGRCLSTTANSRALIAALLLLFGSVTAASADSQKPSLTLREFAALVDKGLADGALVRADVLDAEAAAARARELPELSVSLERQEVFTGGDAVVLQNSIAIGWSLDLSGRRGLRIEAAEASVRATRLRGARAHALIAIDATAIYLQAARARLWVDSLRQSREALAKLTSSLTRRAREGDVSGADVARFELALSFHDDRLAEADAELVVAETRLAALFGQLGRLVASDNLALPQMPPRSRRRSSAGPDAGSPVRSDVLAVDEELAGGRARMRAASRWWIPTVDLSAGYLTTDFGPGTGPGANVADGYLVTGSLSLPIFSRGEAEHRRGQAEVARAQATKIVLERRVPAEIAAARTRMASSVERAKEHEGKRLALTAELVNKTASAYAGGEATALELRDAYEQAANARLRAIELRYQARLAELELWRARGTHRDVRQGKNQ